MRIAENHVNIKYYAYFITIFGIWCGNIFNCCIYLVCVRIYLQKIKKMKRFTLREFYFFIWAMFATIATIATIAICFKNKEEIEILRLERAENVKEVVMYRELLHRIWLTKPSYVEDVLVESDEFNRLNELYDGDWEDTFELWNYQDSIDYEINKYIEQNGRY